MTSPPRLRLEPRASRIGCAFVVVAFAATSLLLAMLPLPLWARVAGASVILTLLAGSLRRCGKRGVPALVHVGIDRRIAVTDGRGRTLAGRVLDDSYVSAWLTTLVWSADGDPWWRPARVILVLPDTLPRDAFRQLRTWLRYGRPPLGDRTSGVEAG